MIFSYCKKRVRIRGICLLLLAAFLSAFSACGKKEDTDDKSNVFYENDIEHDPLNNFSNVELNKNAGDSINVSTNQNSSTVKDTNHEADTSLNDNALLDDASLNDNELLDDASFNDNELLDDDASLNDNASSEDNDLLNDNASLENDNDEDDSHFGVKSLLNRDEITEGMYRDYSNSKCEWSFKRVTDNKQSGTYEPFDINQYSGFYLDKNASDEDKVMYLTFDCGYENGFTNSILDILKSHNVKAMFFVTKYFLKENADLVIRMKEEGHMVGNHTMNHPSLPSIDFNKFKEEIYGLEDLMKDMTGYDLDLFIRPPMGEYSEKVLKILEDMGYSTIFWSIAYVDYDINNQPGKDYVINHFKTYHHTGAIPLLHNVSESNTQALDEVLTYLELQGYHFGSLDEILK